MKLDFINCLESNFLVLFLEFLFLYKSLHFSLSSQGALKSSPNDLCLSEVMSHLVQGDSVGQAASLLGKGSFCCPGWVIPGIVKMSQTWVTPW